MKFCNSVWRDLKKHRNFSLLFIAVLGIGLSGFLLVESLRSSIARSLAGQSRAILSADLAISVRRPFTEAEEATIRQTIGNLPFTKTSEFFSMLAKGTNSRLALVRTIESNYPLYGTLLLDPAGVEKLAGEEPHISVSPDLLSQLDAKHGEMLSLGGYDFRLLSTINEDPTQSFRSFAIGGRAYIHQKFLAKTKLIQPGSTVTHSYLILCPNEAQAKVLYQRLQTLLPNPELRLSTAQEAGENSVRALSYMGDFLGLVSLIALLLSSLGAAYMFRSHLEQRRQEIAIYRALGVQLKTLQLQVVAQTVCLACFALLPALLVSIALLPLLEKLIGLWSPVKLQLHIYHESLIPLVLLCAIGTPLLLLSELLVLKHFSPLALFREDEKEKTKRSPWAQIPVLILFCLLSLFVANSIRNVLFFLGILASLVIVLFLLLQLFTWLLPRFRLKSWTTRHALLFLARKKRSTATIFLTLSLGSLLIHLLPQLETSLRAELETPTSLPSLFLFDIQEEQKNPLRQELYSRGHTLSSISPLVRARIIAINGKGYERNTDSSNFTTREDEQAAQSRNRGINLSYREALQESETLVKGRPLTKIWDPAQLPELSIETRYAERLGIKIGDILRFDVQGVEVEGKIVNERRVRWTSFQPNFFLLFQNGVLNEAPKTYIANLGALPDTEKLSVQTLLTEKFPNISVIDVVATIRRALELLKQMRLALLLLAGLALVAGFSVLASILSLEARDRSQSLILYRVLGASEANLRKILLTESLALSSVAILLGALSSVAFTFILSRFIFDGAFKTNFASLLGFSVLLLTISLLVSWLASRTLVRRSPLVILRSHL